MHTSISARTRSSALRRAILAGGASLALVVASGCNNALEGGASGAAAGSLIGLGIGSLTGSAGKGAAIGALGGAAAGAFIGDQSQRNAQNQQYQDNSW